MNDGRRLFRSIVIESRSVGLAGNVSILIPISWHAIGLLLFCGLITGLLFLLFASYLRIEVASGSIVPDAGVSVVVPTRAGVIASLPVRDGARVSIGTSLASIRVEEASASSRPVAEQIEAAVVRQDASLAAQMSASAAAAEAQVRQLAAQKKGLSAETSQIESQISLQADLIASAQRDLERARSVAARGFISQRDLQVREETLLSRQQGLSQLAQSLAAKQSALAEAERSAAQLSAQARAQSASLAAARAEVAQQAASAAGARSYVLRASVAGRVTALTARVGQPVTSQTPLMTIVPAGSILRAELAVPSSAIGFVKPGQEVRLAIDAFPYQRFGTVKGRVQTVATSAVSAQGPNGTTVAVYPVAVALVHASMAAYGRNQPLIPGMTLTARIVTEKQSLLEWLFEPLLAVQRR